MFIVQIVPDHDLIFALFEMTVEVFEHGTGEERFPLIVELEGLLQIIIGAHLVWGRHSVVDATCPRS